MDKAQLKSLFEGITVWKKGDQRAPHKPLLVLYALAHCRQKRERFLSYSEIEEKLKQLLIEFGPRRKRYHPEYPFWRLKNDHVWELKNAENVEARRRSTDPKKSELIRYNVSGGFRKDIFDVLISDPKTTAQIARQILDANFPSSIHEDILQALGLDIDIDEIEKGKRDPNFREKVLSAYEYQCAICGFNVRVGNALVALEAAHIKWHQAGGPDAEKNGIALCALHHKLFDRGAFTVTQNMKVHVSDKAHGTGGFQEWLLAFHGKPIRPPQRPSQYPYPKFVVWHIREVFQGEPRHLEFSI
jgi:putative restriction endonuclease